MKSESTSYLAKTPENIATSLNIYKIIIVSFNIEFSKPYKSTFFN